VISRNLDLLVRHAQEELEREGIGTVSRRDLANGVRCRFRSGEAACGINFYYSDRKGFSVVPSGGDRHLAERIRMLLKGVPSLFPTDPDDPGAPSGISPVIWIGTDDASSGRGEQHSTDDASSVHDMRIGSNEVSSSPGNWIGSDEAGKGDYMGPLVVAAVRVDRYSTREFRRIGVRDSKLIGAASLERLASAIRGMLPDGISTVVLMPEEYNSRLNDLLMEGRNSLDLLAICHARAIGRLFESGPPPDRVVIDRFCPDKRIAGLLPPGEYALEIRERAESDPAVAAASILARDAYMDGLVRISREYGIKAVPGSGSSTDAVARRFVEEYGPEVLGRVAKLHFSNTGRISRLRLD